MTELYLDNALVVFDNSKTVKVTKENPYFTQSGSYTLDVTIPMNCLENRLFFKNLQRLDVGKSAVRKMAARLVADNHVVLSGSAVINSITPDGIKVQLVGDNSDVNFLTETEEVYIDGIDYGEATYERLWDGWNNTALGDVSQYVFMPIYDETNEEVKNVTEMHNSNIAVSPQHSTGRYAVMPNLLCILNKVIAHFGYTVTANDLDVKPWNRLVVCNARCTIHPHKALPHWKASEFLKEIQYFFNCTVVFDHQGKTARIVSNLHYFDDGEPYAFEMVDEYTAEVGEEDEDENKSLASSNVRFDTSDSSAHTYDVLSDDILEAYGRMEFGSKAEMETYVKEHTSIPERKKYIFVCPEGMYVYGTDGEIEDGTSAWGLRQVNQFGAIIRKEGVDDYIELRICPVAMTCEHNAGYYFYDYSSSSRKWELQWETPVRMPTMKNNLKDDTRYKYLVASSSGDASEECVWAAIIGEQDTSGASAEDRMQVMFVDEKQQYVNKPGVTDQTKKIPYPMGFTDHKDKVICLDDCGYVNVHSSWSLALANCSADAYLGQLHANRYTVNTQTEIQIEFETPSIPDISRVFIFKNKRYVCKKMELNVGEKGLDRLVKGYFFEML